VETMSRDTVEYEAFEPSSHLAGAVALCEALGWPSYADPSVARAAFSAPGTTTWVATWNGEIVGLVHLQSNGVIHAHLSLIGVLPDYRRRGVARHLVATAFRRGGGKWVDLCAEAGSEAFYRSFQHRARSGFRIYPVDPAV